MAPWVASGVAYVVTFGGTYLLQRGWTFRSSAAHATALPKYAVAQLISLLLTMMIVHLFTLRFQGASAMVISAGATVFAASISFILSSRWAFANASKDAE